MTKPPIIKPLGLGPSILYFGIPAAFFSASILGLLPWLVRRGTPTFAVFMVTFAGPLAAMLLAALLAYRIEGHPWSWTAFRDRMRLRRPTLSDWLWTIGLVAVSLGGGLLLGPITSAFSGMTIYDAPAEFTQFMTAMRAGNLIDGPLVGRWDVLAVMVIGLVVFNIGGEELWWRGIILPRQELALGKWAWLVNGLLWDLFHIFYHTTVASIVGYLPVTVPLAFVAQRTRNTWPGIVAHLATNIGLPIAMFLKVIGR
jgi:membrane protease YdiL (CAAX protease family)